FLVLEKRPFARRKNPQRLWGFLLAFTGRLCYHTQVECDPDPDFPRLAGTDCALTARSPGPLAAQWYRKGRSDCVTQSQLSTVGKERPMGFGRITRKGETDGVFCGEQEGTTNDLRARNDA